MNETMLEYSDKELIDLFHKGNNKDYAFNLLVKKYQERIYWHIRKIIINHDDTDDVIQNTFIKVFNNLFDEYPICKSSKKLSKAL